jgi:hypothetical protein
MAGMTMAPTPADAPSATARMVCGDDIKDQVRTVLKLTAAPVTHSTWQHGIYSCTYSLPMGPMVLSVKQSSNKSAAQAYFNALRPQLGIAENVIGLGEKAYTTKTGIAVVIKDNMTLRVDATGLPPVFGAQQQRRTDLAYEIASDVLGCWTGDEH